MSVPSNGEQHVSGDAGETPAITRRRDQVLSLRIRKAVLEDRVRFWSMILIVTGVLNMVFLSRQDFNEESMWLVVAQWTLSAGVIAVGLRGRFVQSRAALVLAGSALLVQSWIAFELGCFPALLFTVFGLYTIVDSLRVRDQNLAE